MDKTKENEYIFNLEMSRPLGLYQILNPNTAKLYGHNVYHIMIVFFGSHLCAMIASCLISIYFSMKDLTFILFYIGCIEYIVFACYKMLNIIYNSKEIWVCICDVTNFNLMTYKHYKRSIFEKWRKRCIRVLYTYAVILIFNIFFWILGPIVFSNIKIKIQKLDGSYTETRLNIFNLDFFVSDETYNRYFNIFYFIEIMIIIYLVYFNMILDVLMFIMCLSLSCQLETISDAIQSLGHKCSIDNNKLNTKVQLEKEEDVIEDLKLILKDHQMITKKMEVYYNIFKPVILSQIFMASSLHIFGWLIISMNYSDVEEANFILTLKVIMIIPLFTFQLFSSCKLFGIINEKKDSIIFALYSSNWTAMSLKSKKMILFAMLMNNVYQIKLKYTITKIVNLEMFAATMRVCYSIFSMLVNYNKRKN